MKRSRSKRFSGKASCKRLLGQKIGANLKELRKGRWKSRAQAIAISYSEVGQYMPSCKRYRDFTRKRRNM